MKRMHVKLTFIEPVLGTRWGAPSFFDRLPAPQGLTVKDY